MVELSSLLANEFFLSFAIFVAGVFAATLFNLLARVYAKKIATRTKTDVDDHLIKAGTKPVYFLILWASIYFALKPLEGIQKYSFWIDSLFFVVGVLIVSFLISQLLGVFVNQWLKVKKRYEKTPRLINKLLTITIFIIGVIIILGYFKIEITPFLATLGVGGIAIGLALQGTLSNFFAGMHIISDRPINVGDFIELEQGKLTGYVEDIGWRSTRLRTTSNTASNASNTIIIVPNSKLADSIITNYSMPEQEMNFTVQCGVAYGTDLEKAEKIAFEAAKKIQQTVSGAVKDFEPKMRYTEFGDSNINFIVTLGIEKASERTQVRHEFIKALKKAFDENGIEISWPVRKIVQTDSKTNMPQN